MKLVAVIPARGGSKGIPRKNIKLLHGKPLIAWSIEAALRSRRVDAVVVSTEDEEIAAVARVHGASVPFMRPLELAKDHTPGLDPVLHALDQLPDYDTVVLLQPTSPLRSTADIDNCVELAETKGVSSVVSVSESPVHPQWMYRIGDAGILSPISSDLPSARRQDLPPVYTLNGAIYLADVRWLRAGRRFVAPDTLAYEMPEQRSIDIDSPFDWALAEILMKEVA